MRARSTRLALLVAAASLVAACSGGGDITDSGDEVADKTTRENFIAAYDKKHTLTPDGEVRTLVIGDNDWPFPIPLVSKDGTWQFDTKAGREEILRRRIGRNELSAIKVCLAYVDAQREDNEAAKLGYQQSVLNALGEVSNALVARERLAQSRLELFDLRAIRSRSS